MSPTRGLKKTNAASLSDAAFHIVYQIDYLLFAFCARATALAARAFFALSLLFRLLFVFVFILFYSLYAIAISIRISSGSIANSKTGNC